MVTEEVEPGSLNGADSRQTGEGPSLSSKSGRSLSAFCLLELRLFIAAEAVESDSLFGKAAVSAAN